VARVLDDRTVEIDGATVQVSVTRTRSFVGAQHFVRDLAEVRAAFVGWGALTARIHAGSYFLALGRLDARIGHAAFDDRYIVKTDEPVALAYCFSDDVPDAVLATYEPAALSPFAVQLAPGEVMLTARAEVQTEPPWDGGLRSYDEPPVSDGPCLIKRIDAAVAAAAAIASRGAKLAAAWHHRLTPLGLLEAGPVWRTDESYVAVVVSGRTRVTIDFPWHLPAVDKDRLRTRLSIRWSGAGPQHGKATARSTASLDWLRVDGNRLSVGWERIVEHPGQLSSAIALLARWAEQQSITDGPYR
jgi:hypothetical protein